MLLLTFTCLLQIIIDNRKNIVYVHSGFLGHDNDAVTYRQLPNIGPGQELPFPGHLRLLADSIYPNQYPLLTPYKAIAMRNVDILEKRRRRRVNKRIRSRRVYVEHIIKDLKTFRVVTGIHRNRRELFPSIVELCAGLAQRKIDFINTL